MSVLKSVLLAVVITSTASVAVAAPTSALELVEQMKKDQALAKANNIDMEKHHEKTAAMKQRQADAKLKSDIENHGKESNLNKMIAENAKNGKVISTPLTKMDKLKDRAKKSANYINDNYLPFI